MTPLTFFSVYFLIGAVCGVVFVIADLADSDYGQAPDPVRGMMGALVTIGWPIVVLGIVIGFAGKVIANKLRKRLPE